MKRMYTYEVNGFSSQVFYEDQTVEEIFLSLLRKWKRLQEEKNRRILVYLSAPPGTGKTTVAEFLEFLSKKEKDLTEIQAVGLDGFHYPQSYILTHEIWMEGRRVPMKEVKGCPETFDIEKLEEKIQKLQKGDVTWPVYDRNLHDVVEDAVTVTGKIVLLEGNWLLSREEPWKKLRKYCDDSVFIGAEEADLKERLTSRKVKGGLSPEEALAFYERSDRKNVQRLMQAHQRADVQLRMESDGTYVYEREGEEV